MNSPCDVSRKALQSKEVVFSLLVGRCGVELFRSYVKEVMEDYPKGTRVFSLLNPSFSGGRAIKYRHHGLPLIESPMFGNALTSISE